jgi:biopolymer transport protein ExbD
VIHNARRIILLAFALIVVNGCATTKKPSASAASIAPAYSAQFVEVAIGNKGKYLWNNRQWDANALQTVLKSELRAHPFKEIRLIDTGKAMTIAHMIEFGAIGKSVGVEATFEKEGKVNKIIFVD